MIKKSCSNLLNNIHFGVIHYIKESYIWLKWRERKYNCSSPLEVTVSNLPFLKLTCGLRFFHFLVVVLFFYGENLNPLILWKCWTRKLLNSMLYLTNNNFVRWNLKFFIKFSSIANGLISWREISIVSLKLFNPENIH